MTSPRALAGALMVVAAAGAMSAGPAFATNPGGASCAADGKINGRGATFQAPVQQNVFTPGFNTDVCHNAGANMVQYNYAAAAAGGIGTGSGNGQKATSCRTDPFGGTDIP